MEICFTECRRQQGNGICSLLPCWRRCLAFIAQCPDRAAVDPWLVNAHLVSHQATQERTATPNTRTQHSSARSIGPGACPACALDVSVCHRRLKPRKPFPAQLPSPASPKGGAAAVGRPPGALTQRHGPRSAARCCGRGSGAHLAHSAAAVQRPVCRAGRGAGRRGGRARPAAVPPRHRRCVRHLRRLRCVGAVGLC